jgi:ATP-dependent helicase/DNAse subunit B
LERYARCGLRFFFVDILNLSGHSALDEDLAAHDQGNLVHRILERFHRDYSSPVAQADWEAAWDRLENTARSEIDALNLRRILREAERRRLLGDGTPMPDGRPGGGLLARILQAECAQASGQLAAWAIPVAPLARSEVQFRQMGSGLESQIKLLVPRPDGGLHPVTGRIDRIDVSRFGDLMVVVDYKTGSQANLANFASMEAGYDFQLALYLLELRQRATLEGITPHLAAAYFVLQDAEFARGIGIMGSLGKQRTKSGAVGSRFVQSGAKELAEEQFHIWLDGIAARAGQIGQLIEEGVFNLTLLDRKTAKCQYCECQSLCGMNPDIQPARALAHRDSVHIYAPRPILSD